MTDKELEKVAEHLEKEGKLIVLVTDNIKKIPSWVLNRTFLIVKV